MFLKYQCIIYIYVYNFTVLITKIKGFFQKKLCNCAKCFSYSPVFRGRKDIYFRA